MKTWPLTHAARYRHGGWKTCLPYKNARRTAHKAALFPEWPFRGTNCVQALLRGGRGGVTASLPPQQTSRPEHNAHPVICPRAVEVEKRQCQTASAQPVGGGVVVRCDSGADNEAVERVRNTQRCQGGVRAGGVGGECGCRGRASCEIGHSPKPEA